MHPEAWQWLDAQIRPRLASARRVLDVGGADVNGSPRGLFSFVTDYLVVDARPAPDVDIVADAATWLPPFSWPSSSTSGVGGSWGGRWPPTFARSWCLTLSTWRPPAGGCGAASIGPGPPGHLACPRAAVASRGCSLRWALWGDAYDNALCESLFATLECGLLDRHRFATQAAARRAVFDDREGWYNLRQRHSALGYLSPSAFERRALLIPA